MNNNIYTAKEISFWKFIKENEIEIPIIQRDYAQGRLGKEGLRKNFLADLKKALDNEKPFKDKAMKMDFVYGSVEHDKMNPLDGQQRLTTLWLLHWYIALHAGKLDDEVAKTLSKFTYETRISSREFCGKLCAPDHFKDFDGKDIVGFITKQTWFYSAWKQDPTIQSMLRMLGGTKVTNKKKEDIVDGIEELFEGTDTEDFEKYWERLASDQAPIVFYHLPLKDFGLSDDLYIKMNARGKQLTSFENFKADLVDYITEQSDSELLGDEAKKNWKSLLDERDGIPIKMDTAWTDIFWKNKPQKNKIDEIYFAFLNRLFWDQLFMFKNKGKYVLDIGKGDETSKQENENSSYKYLNNSDAGQNVYDTTISYKELDVYKFFCGEIPYNVFEDLQNILNRYVEIPSCTWDDSFKFIPAYENDSNDNSIEITDNNGEKIWKVTYLTQVHRVVFHAICKYFIEGDADSDSLRQWMRVVWNLVSGDDAKGPQIRSTQAMRTAMEFIDKLDSHDVYNCLAQYTDTLSDTAFDKRCKEEIAKAKQILDGRTRADGKTWEDIIIEAEKYAFFKGAIRFLFTDGEGNINWCDFDTKWENIKRYFDKNGEIVEKYKTNAILLRALLSRINIGENWFGYYKVFWHTSLLNSAYKSAIHYLLTTPQLVIEKTCGQDWIIHDSLLYELLCCYNSWHILDNWKNYDVLTRYSQRRSDATSHKEIVVLNDLRNKLLNSNDIEIPQEHKVAETIYLYGWNINFKYKNHFFRWYGYPNEEELDVYLMEDNWAGYKKRQNPTNDKGTEEDTHFCFRVFENTTPESFTEMLDCLIHQAEADEQNQPCYDDCQNKINGCLYENTEH